MRPFDPGMDPGQSLPLLILGGVAWLIITAGSVLLIIWAIRAVSRQPSMRGAAAATPQNAIESPLDTIARRFASGEISADEFEHAQDLLGGRPPAST